MGFRPTWAILRQHEAAHDQQTDNVFCEKGNLIGNSITLSAEFDLQIYLVDIILFDAEVTLCHFDG